jgi:hypothetical protein
VTAPERLLKPPTRVPFLNERTGQMAREWELYLLNLLGRTDYVENVTNIHTVDLTQIHSDINALQLEDDDLNDRSDALELLPVVPPHVENDCLCPPQSAEIATLSDSVGVSPAEIVALANSIEALTPIDFYPASMVVNTGTLDGGTVASLSSLDGTLVSISEVTGADPLRVTFSFTGVTRMSAFAFYGYYAGSPSHQLSVEIYNPDTTGWDVLGTVGSDSSARWYSFTIHGEENYINSGAVSTRLRHIQSGIANHDLFLDYLELNYGAVGGSASISASSVTFTPFGNISATNVGSALVELDNEKQATLISTSNIKTINGTTILGAGDLTVTGTGEMNVQADWTQADNAQDDYIKNKPTLGTAAAKNIPAAGNASATEVVYGSDTRLSDSRTASDVSAWAKAATKPTYTAAEVGAVTISQIASLVSIRF